MRLQGRDLEGPVISTGSHPMNEQYRFTVTDILVMQG